MLNTAKYIAQQAYTQHSWKMYAVGGFVRDMVLGIESKDPRGIEQI